MRDAGVLHLGAQTPERVFHNAVVVEGERRQVVGREPAHVLVLDRPGGLTGLHERPVDDRDNPAAGGAALIAESVELLQVFGSQTRGLAQGACGRVGQLLVGRQPAARQCPLAEVGLPGATHERQPQGRKTRLLI